MRKPAFLLFILLCVTVTLHAQSDALYKGRIAAKIAQLAFDEESALWFTDADTGLPLTSARVVIENIGAITTDADGLAIFSTPEDGYYHFTISKTGFMTVEDTFRVALGSIFFNKYSIPPVTPLGHIKIVLDWAKEPADLDIHLVKQNQYHISYHDMIKTQDGTAWLDRDTVTGYGPETITITQTDNNAVYSVYVHDYTNRNQSNNARLSNSRAVIRVYNNNRLTNTFTIEQGRRGVFWDVFEITCGQIKTFNTYR
ncbi:hypothetical protein FACS189468_8760 [Spirochaetia bacterium]|nr:hypothetical protein FACS189468_8760 [Spirochaetia bacterium]